MSDLNKQVSVEVILKGVEKATAYLNDLRDSMDDAANSGTLTGDSLGVLTKGALKTGKAISQVGDALERLSTVQRTGTKETKKYAEGFGELVKMANAASKSLREAAQAAVVGGSDTPTKDLAGEMGLAEARELLAIREAQKVTDTDVARQVVRNAEEEAKARERARKATIAQAEAATKALQVAREEKALAQGGKGYQNLGGLMDEGILERRNQALEFSAQLQKRMGDEQKYLKETGTALDENMKRQADTFRGLNKETAQVAQGSLPRLRYALYDVSTTFAIAGAAMLGFSTAMTSVAIKMDRQFADVLRTTETYMDRTGEAGNRLRADFENLFTSLPVSWSALTEIGTLAGQLGVAQEDVAEFTSLVAKFGATSDVSVEQAATAFGRLSELLDVPASQYENLGSSILSVGIASVATEGQIINTTTQLASIGNFAGLSASEVVGLSSALASLGTQPELSRGSMTRLFTKISEAVSEGGEKLNGFARVSGVTATQFAQDWNNQPMQAIQNFLEGLGRQGDYAVASLKELGIASARDIPTLLRLGQNSELVAKSIEIAGEGFEQGTALQDQYGVIAETVSAKLEVLKNSVQNLSATFGEAGNSLGPVIEFITNVINALNNFIDNPYGKAIATITIAVTALAGVMALLVGGVARGTASMAAMITALNEIGAAGGRASFSLTALRNAMVASGISAQAATAAINGFKAALMTTGAGAAFVAVGTIFSAIAMEANKGREAVEALSQSIVADTRAGEGFVVARDRVVDYERAADLAQLTQEQWDRVLEGSATYAEEYAVAVGVAEDAIRDFQATIGETTLSDLQKIFAEDTTIRDAFQSGLFSAGMFEGFDASELTEIISEFGEEHGLAYINSFVSEETVATLRQRSAELFAKIESPDAFGGFSGDELRQFQDELNRITEVLELVDALIARTGDASDLLNDALIESAYQFFITGEEAEKMGDRTGDAGEGFEELKTEAELATEALKDFIETTFGIANAEISMNNALNNLGKSLHENGTAFDTFSLEGRANLQALQAAFQEAGEWAIQNGYDYRVGINAVAEAMVQSGVISVKQLEALGIETTNFGNNLLTVVEATSQAVASLINQRAALQDSKQDRGVMGEYINQSINNLNAGGERAIGTLNAMGIQFDRLKPPASAVNDLVKQLGMGWDDADRKARKAGGSGSKAAKDTGKAAKEAAQEIRTLSDYVSDLGSVMSAAFDFRFGFRSSQDSTITAFRRIQDSFEEARKKARDLRLEIQDLRAAMQSSAADISKLEYGLSVARDFGDTLREEQLLAKLAEARAKLAEQDADLADKQKDLAKAQRESVPDVTSNTDAAIDQRGAVLSLIKTYQEQIEQFAATGASQKEVEKYAGKLTREFEKQMLQLGYSRDEAKRYGEGLKDFAQIVREVPRDLTVNVSASTGPAEKALLEFTSKKRSTSVSVSTPSASTMKKAGQTAANNFKSGFGSFKVPKPAPVTVPVKFQMPTYSQMMKMQEYIRKVTNNPSFRIALPGGQGGQTFAQGGFTGRGGKFEPAGVVHRGEYVVRKELVDQRTGLPKADAFGQLIAGTPTPAPSYANGGFVNPVIHGTVDLSPMSIQQIARAVQPYLVVDGKVVGEVTSNQFALGTRVGAS